MEIETVSEFLLKIEEYYDIYRKNGLGKYELQEIVDLTMEFYKNQEEEDE